MDAAAFGKVRTYRVDTSNLKGPVRPGDVLRPEQFDVRGVYEEGERAQGIAVKVDEDWKQTALPREWMLSCASSFA